MGRRLRWAGAATAMVVLSGASADAQVTYRNTDIGRPVRIEDAVAFARYALDLYLSPIALTWRDGEQGLGVTPGATYGLMSRTQIDLRIPVSMMSAGDSADTGEIGVAGVYFGVLRNLKTEGAVVPALAVRGSILLPVGHAGPASAHPALTALATRTVAGTRVHFNAQYSFREQPRTVTPEESRRTARAGIVRWMTGVAIDRALPRQSLLLTAEAYASQPLDETLDARWNVGTGVRYQLSPRLTADLGISTNLTGPDRVWSLTFGVGRVTAVRSLLPGVGPWGAS